MKFGVMFANVGPMGTAEGAAGIGQAAEAGGIESLWTVEHTVVPAGYQSTYPYSADGKMPGPESSPIPDPLIWLAFVAASTKTIRLGTGILILPQRNPVVLAKELATLDALSGGRVELGVGVGWLQEEFDALGIPWERRGARTDDYIEAMRALWRDTKASVHNTYTDFDNAISLPQPAGGAVPIVIGGRSNRSARRAAEIGDGYFPSITEPDQLSPLLDIMNSEAQRLHRDPTDIEVTVPYPGDPAELTAAAHGDTAALERITALLQRFADSGVSRTLLAGVADEALPPLLKHLGDRVDLS
jgi:probable F420-dependent oxidoreductase